MRRFYREYQSLIQFVPQPVAQKVSENFHEQFKVVFDAIRGLTTPPEKPRRVIGFEVKEGRTVYRKGRKNGQPRQ